MTDHSQMGAWAAGLIQHSGLIAQGDAANLHPTPARVMRAACLTAAALLAFPLSPQFYHPGREYNVRVASRYFKGPELLVDLQASEMTGQGTR